MKTPNAIIDVRAIHESPPNDSPVGAIHELPLHPPQKNENPEHHRRSIRLQNYDYSKAGAYFVTICTQNHIHHFGEIIDGEMNLSPCGLIIEGQWGDLINHFANVELDEFVIMPNHFHGIIVLTKPESSVGAIPVRENHELSVRANHVRAIHESPLLSPKHQRRKMTLPILIGRFKMLSAKLINEINNNSGNKFWQRNYWEHIIRDEQDLSNIREYIRSNPKNWQKDQLNKANDNPVGSIHETPVREKHEIPVGAIHELPLQEPLQFLYNGVKYDRK